ncbi:MAG: 4Fe-4S dicluster domain-containing protein, partial [Thermodesulfobacteriota bacterium]
GGGLVGMTVTRELSRAEVEVVLVERGERLGGGAGDLRFYYDRPDDVRRQMGELIAALEGARNVQLLKGSRLRRLDGQLGRFRAVVDTGDGGEKTLEPSAVVLATGCIVRPVDATGGGDRCIGTAVMEKLLAENTDAPIVWGGRPVKSVTFVLDLTDDDVKIHTVNAIKQAVLLQDRGYQTAVAARDLKVSVAGMEILYRRAREKGVLFFKYDDPPVLLHKDGEVSVQLQDMTALRRQEWETVTLPSNLVVMGETFAADPETPELFRVMKLRTGTGERLVDDNPQLPRVMSNRRGIFLAGACRFPQIVPDSLNEARAVVQEVMALLRGGSYTPENPVAEVESGKCAVCYTCVRLCPHAAIGVERYGDRNVYSAPVETDENRVWQAARIEPAACYGCGICVAECPARAITLYR